MKKFLISILTSILLTLFLPSCTSSSNSEQGRALQLRDAADAIAFMYEHELKVYATRPSDKDFMHAVRTELLMKNDQHNTDNSWWYNPYAQYPYVQYKEVLDTKINRLRSMLNGLAWTQKGIGARIQNLLTTLEDIKRIVITSSEYEIDRKAYQRKTPNNQATQTQPVKRQAPARKVPTKK